MAVVAINPSKLGGPWTDGYVLERQHTLSSDFLGHDSFGNPQFDTKRSELGELVFRLKNRNDRDTLDSIVDTAAQFIERWNPPFDLIVPMPPSRRRPTYQPVHEIAVGIGVRFSKPVDAAAVDKIVGTPELKDVFDYERRLELLESAFTVNHDAVSGRHILLLDDLFRSGATATVVTKALMKDGVEAVHMLAMTKTRRRT